MLLEGIRALFRPRGEAPPADEPAEQPAAANPMHVAACALLLEIAHADGEFSESEREHLAGVLQRHFALPPDASTELLELAETERADSVDLYRFTSRLQDYDLGQKMVLAEIMWGVVLADGEIAEHETYLTRKISNLLGLQPGYLSAAKAAAAGRREGA